MRKNILYPVTIVLLLLLAGGIDFWIYKQVYTLNKVKSTLVELEKSVKVLQADVDQLKHQEKP